MIEMIWTVAIFSILAAIAIPGFTKWLPSYNLKSAARDVFSNMQLAKLDAIKANSSCIVTFPSATSYTLAFSGGSRTVNLPDYDKNIQFKSPTDSSVTFTPRGMILDTSARQVTITNAQNTATWQITIETYGTISMKKL